MPKFEIGNPGESKPPIRATLELSETGDLHLLLNGARIAGISAADGTLYCAYLADPQSEGLWTCGIKLDADHKNYIGIRRELIQERLAKETQ